MKKESTKDREVNEKGKDKISSKELKREKEENEGRKRDRSEKRREKERRTISPTPYYETLPNDRYYDQYEVDRERDRDRDLSSISNSSNGSTNRRSQDSPDHERG